MYDPKSLKKLSQELENWEQNGLKKSLARLPERREEFITTSSEKINRLYSPLDIADMDYKRDLALPGEYPYTRGIHPTMHRSRLWTMRMFAGFGTAEETNQRFKYLLEQGQTGLSIAFDLPTLMGYDTDSPEAFERYTVRKQGRRLSRCKFPPDLLNEGRFVLGMNASSFRIRSYFTDEHALSFSVDGTGAPGSHWSEKRRGPFRPALEWEVTEVVA